MQIFEKYVSANELALYSSYCRTSYDIQFAISYLQKLENLNFWGVARLQIVHPWWRVRVAFALFGWPPCAGQTASGSIPARVALLYPGGYCTLAFVTEVLQ